MTSQRKTKRKQPVERVLVLHQTENRAERRYDETITEQRYRRWMREQYARRPRISTHMIICLEMLVILWTLLQGYRFNG